MNQLFLFIAAKSYSFGESGELKSDQSGVHFVLRKEGGLSLAQSMVLKIVVERIRAVCKATLPDMQVFPDKNHSDVKIYAFREKKVKIVDMKKDECLRGISQNIWEKNGRVGPLPQVLIMDDKNMIDAAKRSFPALENEFAFDRVIDENLERFTSEQKTVYNFFKNGLNVLLNCHLKPQVQPLKELIDPLKINEILPCIADLEGVKLETIADVLNTKTVKRTLMLAAAFYTDALYKSFAEEMRDPKKLQWTVIHMAQAVQLSPIPIIKNT